MFAPPPRLETRVFARVPDTLRLHGRPSAWAAHQHPGADLGCFIEGPAFDAAGNLFVVDIPFGRIFRVSPEGEFEVFVEYDGEPNGLKVHRDGRLFVADFRRGIMVVDPESRRVEPLVERYGLEPFKGCNDLTFARNGDLYFTDQGMSGRHDPTGRVFRLTAGGRLECLLDRVPSPNGLVLSLDEQTLFLAVTRDNGIWRVPLTPDGRVTKVGLFIQLSGGVGPDGITIDTAGNLIVAHIGLGSVWRFDPRGEPISRIVSCAGDRVTNVAFGGEGNRTLFMTESDSGQILMAELDVPGPKLV